MPVVYTGWTLIYEMYFYLAFAFFLFIFKLGSPLIIVGFFTASYVFGLLSEGASSPLKTLLTSELLLEFNMGILLCYLYQAGFRLSRPVSALVVVAGFALFDLLSDGARLYAFGVPWAIIFFGLVFSNYRMLESKLLVFLGDASYSIYLVQVFALPAVHFIILEYGLDSHDSWILVFMYTLIAVLSGITCYMLLERPLNTKMKSLALAYNRVSPC